MNPLVASLQKKIEQEYSIRDGGSKLLQASKSNRQSMEVSKGLFVSDAKIMGHMRELQRQQSSQGIQTIQSRSVSWGKNIDTTNVFTQFVY